MGSCVVAPHRPGGCVLARTGGDREEHVVMRNKRVERGLRLIAGAAPFALVGWAVAIEPLDVPVDMDGRIAEVQAVVSEEGLTYAEYVAWQTELNGWLNDITPAGIFTADPIRIEIGQADIEAMGTPDALDEPSPLRIGVVKPVTPEVRVSGLTGDRPSKGVRDLAGGVIERTLDGGLVWARVVTSEQAGGLRVHIRGMDLPLSAELYIYGLQGEAFGPYTEQGPNANGEFWTDSILADTAVLLLNVTGPATDQDLRGISFVVSEVGHIGMDFTAQFGGVTAAFCGNVACIVDASCYAGANATRDAIAKMEWIAGAFIYTCTGGLLADNNPTQNNYFLTANHCLSKNNTAASVQFYWRFRTSTCNGACPSNNGWPYKTSGSAVRKTGRSGDFTLLQLNANPPSGSVFLGWTNAPVANTNGVALHRVSNPQFGPQVYSEQTVDTSAPTCQGWPRGQRIYSRDTLGGTDGGSSGSPVVNASNQVVGQLSGACGFNTGDPCDSVQNATVDGAFAYYYALVQPFLNP